MDTKSVRQLNWWRKTNILQGITIRKSSILTYSQEFQGRKRKYYSITESGKEQIEYLNGEWAVYRDTIDGIVEGRIRR